MSDTIFETILTSLADTRNLAAALARTLGAGDLLALSGDLGAGKSELSRTLIRYLLQDGMAEVPSPTFTLVQSYDPPVAPTILHCDLYRLADAGELFELGLDDERSEALMLVEWPDRLPPEWLEDAVTLQLDILPERNEDGESHRSVRLAFPVGQQDRLEQLAALMQSEVPS